MSFSADIGQIVDPNLFTTQQSSGGLIISVADTATVDLDVTGGVLTANATITKYTPAGTIANANTNPAFPATPTVGDAREITTTDGTVGGLAVTLGDLLVFGLSGWFVLQGDVAIPTGQYTPVATLVALNAITTDPIGTVRLVIANGTEYRWNGIVWQVVGTDNQSLTNNLGSWNATTNTPTIVSGVGNPGDFYTVSVAGTTNIDGTTVRGVGDYIWFDADTNTWRKIDNQGAVVRFGNSTYYLDTVGGNNSTALVNRIDRPFATIGAIAPLIAFGVNSTIVIAGGSTVLGDADFNGRVFVKCLGRVVFGNARRSNFSSEIVIVDGGGVSVYNGNFRGPFTFQNFDTIAPTTGGYMSTNTGPLTTFRNCRVFNKPGESFYLSGTQRLLFDNIETVTIGYTVVDSTSPLVGYEMRNCGTVQINSIGGFAQCGLIDGGTFLFNNCVSVNMTGWYTHQTDGFGSSPTFVINNVSRFTGANFIYNNRLGAVKNVAIRVRNSSLSFSGASIVNTVVATNITIDVSNIRRTNVNYAGGLGTVTTVNNTPDYIVTTL